VKAYDQRTVLIHETKQSPFMDPETNDVPVKAYDQRMNLRRVFFKFHKYKCVPEEVSQSDNGEQTGNKSDMALRIYMRSSANIIITI
jgi:hypothetical protein